jgi:formylglycine-generating enzyme required for sulfatase activity
VDGNVVGATPFAADLTSGARVVEIALAGYRTVTERITVEAEHPLAVAPVRLEPLPGRLQITSEPPAATVAIDGQFRGETPLELDLAAGVTHTVRATRAGHDPVEAKVTLERGETRPLSLALAPQIGEVEVVGEPADAEVIVDGESRGRVGQTLHLTAAAHSLEVRRAGYEPQRSTVTPKAGLTQLVRVRLRSEKETQVVARPAVLRTPAGHELRLLSGGRFQMGASRREPGRRANETLREVELRRPFYLAAREVTNGQFKRFKPDHSSGRFGPHDLGGEANPVVQITWEDAAAYCNWLSAQEGLEAAYAVRDGQLAPVTPLTTGYRLPTEAEWSRAARYPGPGPLKYPWGDALPAPPRSGNFADESARALVPIVLQGYNDGFPATAQVGSFPPNALGLYDLGGNVAEWVHDAYSIPPAESGVEVDPAGPPPGELHVVLGSSFLQGSVSELRLSYRDYAVKPRADVGFRIARYAP